METKLLEQQSNWYYRINYLMKVFVLNFFFIILEFIICNVEKLHIAATVSALLYLQPLFKKYSQQLRFLRTTTALDKRY